MPSSISNSSHRAPSGRWGRTWLAGLMLTVVTLGGVEAFWRHAGHRPSVVDGIEWWAFHRSLLESSSPKILALLGSSRIQLAISPSTLRNRFPEYRVVQLAVGGQGPLAALRDLADESHFRGVVICSAGEFFLHRSRWEDQQEYVDYYHHHSRFDRRMNRLISCAMQSQLVLVHPRVSFLDTLASLARDRRLPEMEYLVTHFDRSISADYTQVADLEAFRQLAIATTRQRYDSLGDTSPWLEDTAELDRMVHRIKQRGGKMVFVRFPSTGDSYAMSERSFPKKDFWDPFAARTPAVAIHFNDISSLSGFECPDTSHLDFRDAPRFTNALLDEMILRGVLPRSDEPSP